MQNDPTENIWKMHMQTLTKRKRIIEIGETIDKVLYEWYSERGREVPKWKINSSPSWWISYLEDLGMDTNNR